MASRAFMTTFSEQALVPDELLGWDEYAARLFRYHHYQAYYDNTIYGNLSRYAETHRNTYGLYKHIRGIYNQVARQNDLYVSSVYGGAIDMEHLTGGSIPIVSDNEALKDAIRQGFTWSRFGELKSLYVRWGALYGDVVLKVVDDRDSQKVRMEVLHPGKLREAEFDSVGNIKSATIEYEREEDPSPSTPSRFGLLSSVRTTKTYLYTERITQDKFETFKDGEPFAYYADANGNMVSSWDNEYGFVPLVVAHHKEVGLKWGANSFHNVTRKIDEVNDFASLLNDQVRKSVNVLWYFAGVRSAAELDASTETRDEMPAIYGPADSEPHPMIAPLPIDQALGVLKEMLIEGERDLPELALQRIREGSGDKTAPGVRAQFMDGIGRMTEAMGNYDAGLVRGVQMMVSIGGHNRYDGFAGFDLNSYAAGDMDFYIRTRSPIDDSLSTKERLTVMGELADKPAAIQKLMMRELDFSEDEIEDVIAEIDAENKANMPTPNLINEGDAAAVENMINGLNGGAEAQPALPAGGTGADINGSIAA